MLKTNNAENLDNVLLKNPQTESLIADGDLAEAARKLFAAQKDKWTFLNSGYESLKNVQTRIVNFDSFDIILQHNPNRITSSQAEVDEESVKKRTCFLCFNNLPPEQKGLVYGSEYLILCNPFPIFPEHFTLPNINHFPQEIKSSVRTLLNLSRDLSKYNGPRCGASAPDHMHFQAGSKIFLPVEKNFERLKQAYGEKIIRDKTIEVSGIDDGIRRFISIESNNYKFILNLLDRLFRILEKLFPDAGEPPINIISTYEAGKGWRIIVFLRSKHRPSHYFREGNERILLSPGAADMGGICILPVEKDFRDLDKETLAEIFTEVTIGKEFFVYVKSSLKEKAKVLFNFGS